MAEDREALLSYYREMHAALLAAIDGLSEAQLTETSLDGWSVKDHLAHLAAWDEIRASEVVRISVGFNSAYRMTDEQDAAFNELLYATRRDLPFRQVRWESARAHETLLLAIRRATKRGLDASLYGEAGLTSGHEAQHTAWIKRWRSERGY